MATSSPSLSGATEDKRRQAIHNLRIRLQRNTGGGDGGDGGPDLLAPPRQIFFEGAGECLRDSRPKEDLSRGAEQPPERSEARAVQDLRSDFEAMGFMAPAQAGTREPLRRPRDRQDDFYGRGGGGGFRDGRRIHPGSDRRRLAYLDAVPTVVAKRLPPDPPSWIMEAYGLDGRQNQDDSFSNASDESIHSVHSQVRTRKEQEEDDDEEDLDEVLEPGEYVKDIVKSYSVRNEGRKVSVRMARDWLDQVGSDRVDDEKKVKMLEKLLRVELNKDLAGSLIMHSTGVGAGGRRLLDVMEILLGRRGGMTSGAHLTRAISLTAELFSNCLALDKSEHRTSSVAANMDKGKGNPVIRGLVDICDPGRSPSVSAEALSILQKDLQDQGGIEGRVHRVPKGEEGETARVLTEALGLPRDRATALAKCELILDCLGVVSLKKGGVESLETTWTTKFGEFVKRKERATGGVKASSARIKIVRLLPTLHCLAYLDDGSAPAAPHRLADISSDLLRLTDRRTVYAEATKRPGTLVTVEAPAPIRGLARGVTLQCREGADPTTGEGSLIRVYLLDYGHQVEVEPSRVAPLPTMAQKIPPLVQFLKIQGVEGLPDKTLVSNCGKLLHHLLSVPSGVAGVLNARPALNSFTRTLLTCEDNCSQLCAVRLLRETYKLRWANGNPLSDKADDQELCTRLVDFLRRAARLEASEEGGLDDALFALFFVLDLMPESFLYATLDRVPVEDTIDAVVVPALGGSSSGEQDLRTLAKKIRSMRSEGNSTVNNKKVREKQMEAILSERPRQQHYQHYRRQGYNRIGGEGDDGRDRRPRRLQQEREREQREGQHDFQPRFQRHLVSVRDLRAEEAEPLAPEPRGKSGSDPEDDQHSYQQQQQQQQEQQAGRATRNVNRVEKLQAEISAQAPRWERRMILDLKRKSNLAVVRGSAHRTTSKDEVATHICAFLNGGTGGRVLLGVEPDTGLLLGMQMTRKDKDLFRQGFDIFLGGRFIQPRVLSDTLSLDFRELHERRPIDPPFFVIDIKVGPTAPPRNRYRVMEGVHRNKLFVRHNRETRELTHDLQRRITIEEEMAKKEAAKR